jgi:hypothetical protein
MQIQPEHIQSSLASFNEHCRSTCLECRYTGSMGVQSKKRKHSKRAIAGIALAMLAPLLALEWYLHATTGVGISLFWFLLAGGVAYGVSLLEEEVLICPNCSARTVL